MKIYGIKSKRGLGNLCPCCGPWRKDYRSGKKSVRQQTRKLIDEEVEEIKDESEIK